MNSCGRCASLTTLPCRLVDMFLGCRIPSPSRHKEQFTLKQSLKYLIDCRAAMYCWTMQPNRSSWTPRPLLAPSGRLSATSTKPTSVQIIHCCSPNFIHLAKAINEAQTPRFRSMRKVKTPT